VTDYELNRETALYQHST